MPSLIAGAEEIAAKLEPVVLEGFERLAESLYAQNPDAGFVGFELSRALTVAAVMADERARGAVPLTTVKAPILITGFGRTGSTYLHNLMSLDRALRAPNLWELWRPIPAPRPLHRDYRIGLAHSELRQWSREQIQLHPMHAERPDECYWIIPHQHCHALAYNAESYVRWMRNLSSAALRQIYEYYRDYVRILMAHYPERRWLGKCLAHMHFVPVLHEVFPQAKLIRLHRNPHDAIASHCGLLAAFTKASLPQCDPLQSRRLVVDVFADGARRMMQADASIDCVDILFDDLIANPVETVAIIYDRFGLDYSEAFHLALTKAAASPVPPTRPRPHMSDIGLTDMKIDSAMNGYISWAETQWRLATTWRAN